MHEKWMRLALSKAKEALDDGLMPVGAVLVRGDGLLATARKTHDSNRLSHAEINLLNKVLTGNTSLKPYGNLTIYTTLEPCIMCWGTIRHVRIPSLVYALEDAYGGNTHLADEQLAPRHRQDGFTATGGVLREESKALFRQFLETTDDPFWRNGGGKELRDVVYEPA
ncbi:MAG: nucleoside deaminase [Pseudomonadaceae bacterium]|nr:nucleoside deaminase [Pseudomonadaceae bacterium]